MKYLRYFENNEMIKHLVKLKEFTKKNSWVVILLLVFTVVTFSFEGWDGFLKLIIGVAGIIIAYQQWQINLQNTKINEDKLRLELFDKRLNIYNSIMDLIYTIVSTGDVTDEEIRKFRYKTREVNFFFDKDIIDYEEEVYRKAVEFQHFERKLNRIESSEGGRQNLEFDTLVDNRTSAIEWFGNQFYQCKKIFEKYIGFKVSVEKSDN